MTISINDAGTWKTPVVYLNNAGTWVVPEIYLNDGGTWKLISLSDLNTTVTVGSATIFSSNVHISAPYPTVSTHISYTGYGFDAGADYYNHSGSFGSIGTNHYVDVSGTSRTITSSYYSTAGMLYITMSGSSIPDTDNTFNHLVINGTSLARSGRYAYYSNSPSGNTTWQWSTGNAFGTSGTVSFKVQIT